MKFEDNLRNLTQNFGRIIGFFGMYIIFTLIFFYFLSWLGKIPESWTLFHTSLITSSIILFGIIINLILRS